jgi:hypothetical protein
MKSKHKPKANLYAIISRAVEEGIAYGYRRAYKHTDKPTEESLKLELESAVMGAYFTKTFRGRSPTFRSKT